MAPIPDIELIPESVEAEIFSRKDLIIARHTVRLEDDRHYDHGTAIFCHVASVMAAYLGDILHRLEAGDPVTDSELTNGANYARQLEAWHLAELDQPHTFSR